MWNHLIRKHCTDEDLLAYADGELSPVGGVTVKNHLSLCWQCRERLKEIEEQTQLIVRAVRDDSLPGPDRLALARMKFLTWQQQFERSLVEAPRLQVRSSYSARAALLAAACVAVFAAGLIGWFRSTAKTTADTEILARTEKADDVLLHTPALVHQSFQVRMTELRPRRAERTGRIEVWSYSNGLRSASRWSDGRGVLREAVWRSGNDSVYVYKPNVAPGILTRTESSSVKVRSLLDLSGFTGDVGQFEEGVMAWLESRDWRPIALSSDIRIFTNNEGATLKAERIDGRLCLEAEHSVGGVQVRVSLQLDADSYEPHLQTIRFESAGRAMEVELTGEECTLVSAPKVLPAVFNPHLPEAAPATPASVAAELKVPKVVPEMAANPAIHETTPRFKRAMLGPLEMEVRYALHRIKACLGEPTEIVEVIQENTNYLELRGVVETKARKEEVVAALAEFPSVRLNLMTAEEALAAGTPFSQGTGAPIVASQDHMILSNRKLSIEPVLETLFAENTVDKEVPVAQKIAELSTRAVSLSQSALSDVWALRHLQERYGRARADLPVESRWLLKLMVEDHMRELEGESKKLQELLNPVMAKLGDQAATTNGASREGTDKANPDWASMTQSVFETTVEVDTLVRGLFAGAEQPQTGRPVSAEHHPALSDGEQLRVTMQELRESFSLLQSKFDWFEVASQNALR